MSDFGQELIEDLRANDGHPTRGWFVGRQVLILTTTGAKSGDLRDTPLTYSRDGDDLVISASNLGGMDHPSWYHNLLANPHVKIEANGETFEATARVAEHGERRRLYDQHAELHPVFTEYETRTSRVIPVVVLHREVSEFAT